MAVKLYDYQLEMKASILEALVKHEAVMCQMPTGTGKTHVLAAVVREFAKRKTIWVVAHRRELTEQISLTWEKFYQGGKDAPEVRVLSIQWLSRNWEKVNDEHPCLIVIDEAHHALAETYQELWRRYPGTKKLGMTATPYRMSGRGFTDLFNVMLQSKSIPEFIIEKRLSLFDLYTVPKDSKIRRQIALMKKRGADGDFQTKELELTLNTSRHIEYLYNSLIRYAKNRKGIVYAINIDHARAIADFYTAKGLKCLAIDCKTPAWEREAEVEAFRRGEIDVLVNVDIFSEGFDCPEVEFIQLARPTLSLAVYLQQVGRGLRKSKGKRKCVILDNVGLSRTFGTPICDWDWEKSFSGNAKSYGIDPEERKMLVKYLGHPGKLVDETMEKLVSHDEMDDAIRYQNMLVYKNEPQPVGIRIGGRTIVNLPVEKVLDCKENIAAVLLRNGDKRLVFANGNTYLVYRDFLDFNLLQDGVLQLNYESGIRYLDLYTWNLYSGDIEVVCFGHIEMLRTGGFYIPRYGDRLFDNFNKHDVDETCWHGFYFKAKPAERIFRPRIYVPMTRSHSWEKPSVDIVLFPMNPMSYYFVSEFPDGSIVIATVIGEYYLARPTGERKLLFIAESYPESKEKYDRWRIKYEKRVPRSET